MANNLSVTFRNVGNRKAAKMHDNLIELIEDYDVSSASIRIDNLDISDIEQQQVVVCNREEKNYILQGEDSSCQLITLLNAYIYKTGRSPIKYRSKHFYKLLTTCGGDAGGIVSIQPASEELNLEFKRNRIRNKSLQTLKKWIIMHLKKDNPIDFSIWHPRWNGHSFLIVEHKRYTNTGGAKTDIFKCINAQLNTEENAVEHLSWEQIIATTVHKEGFPYHNKKENTGHLAASTIKNTKAIIFKP